MHYEPSFLQKKGFDQLDQMGYKYVGKYSILVE